MRQGADRGRSLLKAAMELLPDDWIQVFVASFRVKAGDPTQQADAEHSQQVIWREMVEPLRSGDWVAVGFSAGSEEPRAIHPQFFDSAAPDLVQNTVTSHGVTYTAVRVFEAAPTSAVIGEAEPTQKGKGGRKPVHDWTAFAKEVVRFALLDGFDNRRELTAHMRDWCATTWLNPPGDEAIRQKVVDMCPDEVPAE